MMHLQCLRWGFPSHKALTKVSQRISFGADLHISHHMERNSVIKQSENIWSFPKGFMFGVGKRNQEACNMWCCCSKQLRLVWTLPFHHDENMNAARILRSLPNYKGLMYEEDENMLTEDGRLNRPNLSSPATLCVEGSTLKPAVGVRNSVLKFMEASYASNDEQLTVTHPKNEDIVKAVMREIKELSDNELCQIIYHLRWFSPCPSSKDPPYHKLWSELDKECLERSLSWSTDFCFLMADLWYGIGLARMSEFHWKLIKRLFRRCDKLKKEHFVRFMFALNLNREIPPDANSYDLEYSLNRLADELTAEEVVIVGMGFFKTQRSIKDPLIVKKILSTAMKSSEILDSVSVAAIAKIARYSSDLRSGIITNEFQQKFVPEIPRLSLTACTHIALIGTNSLSPHKPFVQSVVDRVTENISEARLKEIERICLAATMFNVECDELCKVVAAELQSPERADEIRKYGRSLPALLHYLSIKNIFIPDLMSTCLSKAFRDTYYGRSKETFQREMLCLDVVADIELPEYNGNRLERKMFNLIMKKTIYRLKSPQKVKVPIYEKFIRSASEVMHQIMKDRELFHLCNILPHHNIMALVYCRNKEGQIVPVPQYYQDLPPYEIKKIKENSEVDYHAVILCSRSLHLNKTTDLTGQAQLQIRQTKKLGYKTSMVYYSDWESEADPLKKRQILESNIS